MLSASAIADHVLFGGDPGEGTFGAADQSRVERTPVRLHHREFCVFGGFEGADAGGAFGGGQGCRLLPVLLRNRVGDRPVVPVMVGEAVVRRAGQPDQPTRYADPDPGGGELVDEPDQCSLLRSSQFAYSVALSSAGGISGSSSVVELVVIPSKSS